MPSCRTRSLARTASSAACGRTLSSSVTTKPAWNRTWNAGWEKRACACRPSAFRKPDMPPHRTWVEVDERALVANLNVLRSLTAPGARFCAVVKANAYGHGLRETVQILARNGVDAFAVDSLDDGLSLRSLLPSALVLVAGYVLRE